jgi:hypothetical protein
MGTIRACCCLAAAAAFASASVAFSQKTAFTRVGPVPPSIGAAKTIFVSNAGSDSGLFPEPFSGDQDRPYTQFYSALKATGAYVLADDPSQADLVLELRLTAPYGPTNPDKVAGAADPLPMFRLVVYDRKTIISFGLARNPWKAPSGRSTMTRPLTTRSLASSTSSFRWRASRPRRRIEINLAKFAD